MSSVCLADVQEFWILCWIFAIMITACLELLSQTEIYYSWMLHLFIQSSMADYFDIPLRHTCFPLHVDNSGRLHKLESINNKCFKGTNFNSYVLSLSQHYCLLEVWLSMTWKIIAAYLKGIIKGFLKHLTIKINGKSLQRFDHSSVIIKLNVRSRICIDIYSYKEVRMCEKY